MEGYQYSATAKCDAAFEFKLEKTVRSPSLWFPKYLVYQLGFPGQPSFRDHKGLHCCNKTCRFCPSIWQGASCRGHHGPWLHRRWDLRVRLCSPAPGCGLFHKCTRSSCRHSGAGYARGFYSAASDAGRRLHVSRACTVECFRKQHGWWIF